LVPNQYKGDGDGNVDGEKGLNKYSDDYTPFFAGFDGSVEFPAGEFKNGKYITPGELSKTDGFKKIFPLDFEDVLIQLEDFYIFKSVPHDKQETFKGFKFQLDNILASIGEQGLNKTGGGFKFSVQRVLPIGKKFYKNDFFNVIAELDLGDETIQEVFESYYTIVDEKKLNISNYSKFVFNSEFYSDEKNILGHRLENVLNEKLKY
jgi:hypothetical protein